MGLNHCRIYMGKTLDAITTLIDPAHYIIEEFGSIGHALEPGEPNLPTADEFTFVLANLSPTGQQRYPYSFWRTNRRSPEEGGTLPVEIFFRVEILGKTEFLGVYDSVSYGIRDEKVSVTIKDLAEIFKQDQRRMLGTFDLGEVEVFATGLAGDTANFNFVEPARDHAGQSIIHEAITIKLINSITTRLGPDRVPDRNRNINFSHPFFVHLGLSNRDRSFDLNEYDVTRNMFIQIGQTTIFTKCRIWGETATFGRNTSSSFYITIYHSKEPIVNDIIPRGRFFRNEDLQEIQPGNLIPLIIHDYRVPKPGESAAAESTQIILSNVDLPATENYLHGSSYQTDGAELTLTTERYSYFDVIARTLEIFEDYIGDRFTSQNQTGSIEILSDAPLANAGAFASFDITVTTEKNEAESFRIIFPEWESDDVIIFPPDDKTDAKAEAIKNAINSGNSSINWTASRTGSSVNVVSKQKTSRFNNFTPYIEPFYTASGVDITTISGGADLAEERSWQIRIGRNIAFAEINVLTDPILSGESKESIVAKIKTAIETDPDWAGNYTATITGALLTISKINASSDRIQIDINPIANALVPDFRIKNMIRNYDLFDLTKLIERNRHAFFADPLFFGWIDRKLVDILLGIVWQTTAYLYTNADGKLAIQSRDWYETFPDIYDADTYPVPILDDQFLEPTSGIERENGFNSYSIEFPVDIVEINNLKAEETDIIYVDGDSPDSLQTIGRRGQTEIVPQTLPAPSSNDKKLKSSNYRIYDLGVPAQGDITNTSKILRLSPSDPAWPHEHTLDDFLPTPLTQAVRFARTFRWPVETIHVRFFRNRYPQLDAGDYVVLSNLNLYLIKEIAIEPGSLMTSTELEYKKTLVTDSITADSGAITADNTLITTDQT